jgi:iron-sulfur cluster assembly accessory protein
MINMREVKPIVTFTPAAVKYLLKELAKANASIFRLSVKDSGCNGFAYKIDLVSQAEASDIQLTVDNNLAVAIQADAVKFLSGTEIDYALYENGLGLKKLVFNNPNVTSQCGCGESFGVRKSSDDE